MTREEAIHCLSVHSSTNGSGLCTDEQHYEAKQMAIKALEQEPCEDAISRQALLDDFGLSEKTRKWGGDHSGYNTMMLYEIQDMIESAPSVNPQHSGDLINRQDAIKAIDEKAKRIKNEDTLNGLAGAVGILFDLPSVIQQEPCNDITAFKEDVLDAISRIGSLKSGTKEVQAVAECLRAVEALSPVKPQEPKTGHWIIIDDCEKFIAKCSECGRIEDSRMISKYPYCHCGARMVEPQESEETDG